MGFTASSSYDFLPRLLTLANSSLKGFGVVLNEMVTMQQMEALHADRIDFGLVRPPIDKRDLDVACVAREPWPPRPSEQTPVCERRAPTMKDLAGEPFITFSPVEGRYFLMS